MSTTLPLVPAAAAAPPPPPAAAATATGAPGPAPTDWFEDEAFWEAFAPSIFSAARVANTVAEVDAVLGMLFPARPNEGPAPGDGSTPKPTPSRPIAARVLDLCCGPGRHTLELARRGHRVTGVDRTACLLDLARQRLAADPDADALAQRVEFVREDARRFVRPESFDAAINLYTSFGYFRDDDDNVQVLRHVHASLRPGGRLVMEMAGKEILARIFVPSNAHRLEDGSLLVEERVLNRNWSWLDCRWTLVRPDGRVHCMPYGHWVYSARELIDRLDRAGFPGGEIQVYGSLQGLPYDQQARRLVVVARKPG